MSESWENQWPVPVQPITYYGSTGAGRPGVITTIGVLSIVLGSIGILASGFSALGNFALIALARTTAVLANNRTAARPNPIMVNRSNWAEDSALNDTDRDLVLSGLLQVRPLTDIRQKQLRQLLSEHGKPIAPVTGPGLTAQLVAANVSDSGQTRWAGGGTGADFYVVGNGRVEVLDDHATFFPLDGTPPLRSQAPASLVVGLVPSATGQAGNLQSVLRRLVSLGVTPNTAQTRALEGYLKGTSSQNGLFANDGSDPGRQIAMAQNLGNGSLMISTAHGSMNSTIVLDSAGGITSSTFNYTAFATAGGNRNLNIRQSAIFASTIMALLSFLLAMFLIISGILMLRSNSKGARLHWIYVGFKIPLVLISIGMTYWIWSQIMPASPRGGAAINAPFLIMFLVSGLFGLAYPVVLVFLLNGKSVREYYDASRE